MRKFLCTYLFLAVLMIIVLPGCKRLAEIREQDQMRQKEMMGKYRYFIVYGITDGHDGYFETNDYSIDPKSGNLTAIIEHDVGPVAYTCVYPDENSVVIISCPFIVFDKRPLRPKNIPVEKKSQNPEPTIY